MPNRAIITDGGIFPRGFKVDTAFPFPLRRADELVDLCYGKALREPDRVRGAIPVYGTNGPCGWHNAPLTKGPGVILGRKGMGPLGVEWCESDFWVIDTAYFVRAKTNDMNIEYFYYLVKYIGLNHLKDGTSNPSLSRDTFGALLLPTPPLKTQRRVVEIVRTLDDKIELNRRMNETLEAMARRLFKSWFVDFDPVHAKATLRREHPKLSNAVLSRRALPQMSPEIAELFPDGFEESTLGPIPKGWRVSRIEEVSEINGWTLGKNDQIDIIDYIEISQVMSGDIGEIARYQRGEEPSRARRRLRHGDVVLSTVRPDRGAYFVAVDPPASLIASTGFAVFTSTTVPWSWTSCALTSPDVFDYLGHHADGGAYPAINPALIGKIAYAIPSYGDVPNAFHSLAEDWYRLAENHRRESLQLRKTRDKLLPLLLSGEMEVG